MSLITHKAKRIIAKTGQWLVCMLIAGLLLVPAPALAASKTYAVECSGSNVQLHGNALSCSTAPAAVNIEGIGGAKQPYPNGAGVATVTVNCGRSQPVNPKVGAAADFKCKSGSPTISNLNQVQAYAKATPPPPAPTTPPTSCNASGCDLIAQYVNPTIDLLSAAFGLIAVISLILGGIQFSMSEGDPQKASQAKNRISNTIIAIVAYSLLYGFLQFLVPGGAFNG